MGILKAVTHLLISNRWATVFFSFNLNLNRCIEDKMHKKCHNNVSRIMQFPQLFVFLERMTYDSKIPKAANRCSKRNLWT